MSLCWKLMSSSRRTYGLRRLRNQHRAVPGEPTRQTNERLGYCPTRVRSETKHEHDRKQLLLAPARLCSARRSPTHIVLSASSEALEACLRAGSSKEPAPLADDHRVSMGAAAQRPTRRPPSALMSQTPNPELQELPRAARPPRPPSSRSRERPYLPASQSTCSCQ